MPPSPSSKAMITYVVLLTLAYQLTDQSRKFVKADETLIQVECHSADEPEVCIQCLESDPRSIDADKVGIAEIIVSCLSNHAHSLQANMTTLASSTKDGGFKMELQKCGRALSTAESDLTRATLELQKSKYDNAEHWVSEALWYEVGCDDTFGGYKGHLPPTVVYEMKVYQELSEAASRIIERL